MDIPGFNTVCCYTSSVHTGGTLIYIKHGYRYKEIINITKDKNMWMCGVEISLRNQKYYQYCVYHSPKANDADHVRKITQLRKPSQTVFGK